MVITGVIGSVLVAVGSFGVGDIPRNNAWLQNVGLSWVYYGHGKSLLNVVFWAGVVLLVLAWIRLGRLFFGDRGAGDRPAVPTRVLQWSALSWAAPLMVAVPVYSRDVYAYLAQGALLHHGFDPYADGPVHRPGPLLDSMAQVWATTTAPYGPLFMTLTRAVTALTGDHAIAGVLAMRIVMLPGLLLTLWAIPHLARHFGSSVPASLWLVAFNPMLLIHLVGGPHVELLMMGVLAAGLVLVLRGSHVSGVVVLALATAIKITAGVALPFVLWIWLAHLRERRAVRPVDVARVFAAIVGCSVVVFGVFTLMVGHGLGWLTGLGWADRIINWLTIPTLVAHVITVAAAPFTALHLLPVLSVTRTVGSVVLAVVLLVCWWRFRASERSAMLGMTLALLAVLLLEPSTLPWYYTWALVPASAFVLSRRVAAVIAGCCVLQLIVFQPDDSILLYEPVPVVICLAVAAVAGWSLIGRPRRPTTRLHTAGDVR
ncbi:alpha-(1-_6)-mannopyranosyltransferase A [Williamsia sterculiae]|nr:alpha-(1->6)-mannopyranosyltransferase A [Williamsia sterculiae]